MKHKRIFLTLSLAELEALRAGKATVFECAHHWVTNESINLAIFEKRKDDPTIPWTEHTDRAARIATIAVMMAQGTHFPPLALRVFGHRGELFHIELEDGHHRLRAMQYLGNTRRITFAVAGNVTLLRALLKLKPWYIPQLMMEVRSRWFA